MKRWLLLLMAMILSIAVLTGCDEMPQYDTSSKTVDSGQQTLQILMSADMEAYEPVVQAYFAQAENALDYQITYEGIADIQRILQADECEYDVVWLSNSIPLHMLSGGQRVTNSRFTGISPVVYGMRARLAASLGLDKDITMQDLIGALEAGKFTLTMPSITQDNSGRSAYIAVLYSLLGSPKVLTEEMLDAPVLQERVKSFFAKVNRAAGSEAFVSDTMVAEELDCIVASEAALIRLNRRLEASGQETLRLLYPTDGVTVGDAPMAYVNKGSDEKLAQFTALQDFVLSTVGQQMLAEAGMRTDLGGLIAGEHRDVFRAEWGIAADEYINTLVYPASGVISKALTLYQESFKKPTYIAFCLDFSGSMSGGGIWELKAAMDFILDPAQASRDYIQMTAKDNIIVYAFASDAWEIARGNGAQGVTLYSQLAKESAGGSTHMYSALAQAIQDLQGVDRDAYSVAIVNMTDGAPTGGRQEEQAENYIQEYYQNAANPKLPIYSIMFGDSLDTYVQPMASLSGGKVFDGTDDLAKTFREVMGYN